MKKIHFKSEAAMIAALTSDKFRGRAMHVVILHDDQCTPDRCVCEPEFILEDLTVENYMAGQRAQAKWKKDSVS